VNRPWHLPEDCHVTSWTTREMVRMIKRRDPTRPGLWYLSYCHPHPPLAPLRDYVDLYRDRPIDTPSVGEWSDEPEQLPHYLRASRDRGERLADYEVRTARRAFYALCTHIDHQLRVVIGTLREEGLIDNTILLFTADHGDMLGKHGLWAKRVFYEESAAVPMLLTGVRGDGRVPADRTDDRLVGLQDVMPTLLELCGLEVPATVQGLSMVKEPRRQHLFGEIGEGAASTRMVHDGRHKLIYYPLGNRVQLFDLEEDPEELRDVAGSPEYTAARDRLEKALVGELYGGDQAWARDGELVGLPDQEWVPRPGNRGLSGQRGGH